MRSASLQTPDGFRSFAELLQSQPAPEPVSVEMLETVRACEHEVDALRELRLFRARLADAVETATAQLLGEVAATVVGRELQTAPAELQSIVERVLERFAQEEPVRVRVHPDDVQRLAIAVPVCPDAALMPGDAVVDVRCGSVDASLGIRFAALLDGLHAG